MRSLDKFLDALCLNPILKNSQVLQDFLQMPENDFNNKKKEYTKYKSPTKIHDIKTLTGEV